MRQSKIGLKQIIIIGAVVLLIAGGVYVYISKQKKDTAPLAASEKFKALQTYLISNGYNCKNLNNAGSSCEKENDVNKFSFFRYDDGVHYITESLNYKVNILSRKDSKDISIQTFDGALEGYQNKKYTCTSENGTIITSNITCKSEDNENLDNEVYLTVVRNALNEVRVMIDKSGYSANKLVTEYDWQK